MTPRNNSDALCGRLIVIFIAMVIAGFVIPQGTLNSNQSLLLWVAMPFVGWLWIKASVDATREH
jgi:hypothetical protein